VFGVSEGGNPSLLFAATYPERTAALMTFGSFAKRVWSPEYPWAPTPQARAQEYALVEREWGNLMDLSRYIPSRIHDADYVRQAATYFRRSVSPRAAVALLRMNTQIDASSVLPAIRVPTLVMHRTDDRDIVIDKGRWLAARIQGAKFVGLLGDDHWPWIGDCDSVLDEVQEFVTGVAAPARRRPRPHDDPVTDIVGSTERLAGVGDRAWRELLGRHDAVVRHKLAAFAGPGNQYGRRRIRRDVRRTGARPALRASPACGDAPARPVTPRGTAHRRGRASWR
jgi:hypothetical protein